LGTPFFTILMPTRNRAELLQHSIRTALAQTFSDFEILVSANNCSDDTEEVARSTGDARVRVVNPGKTLAMPDHWDFALTHARGRYVTCLSDDDAIVPTLLATLYDLITADGAQLIVWNAGAYYYPDCQLIEKRRSADFPLASGKIVKLPSAGVQIEQFQLIRAPYVPRFLNSCNPTQLSHSIQQEVGRAFVGSCPDYSYPAFLLAREPEVVFIDRPLMLAGWSSRSIGASSWIDMGEAAQEFLREFANYDQFQHVSLKTQVTSNYIADTLEAARALDPRHQYPPLDVIQYFSVIWSELQQKKVQGLPVEAAEQQFRDALAQLDSAVQTTITEMSRPIDQFTGGFRPSSTPSAPARFRKLRRIVRSTIEASAAIRSIERALRGPRVADVLHDFHARRFDTIIEAIEAVQHANESLGWH
jgi:hypothetical protein